MSLKVEDEYHCSKRLLALATVLLLVFFVQMPSWCLNVTFVYLSNQTYYPQLAINQVLNNAAATIQFYTGLSTDVSLQVVVHPDGHSFQLYGFPFWAAGVYREGKIHLRNPHFLRQKGILENTIAHELLHAIIDKNHLSLPSWFEEGLACFLFPNSLLEPDPNLKTKSRCFDQALSFYLQSRTTGEHLFKGKNSSEIRHFFLQCQQYGFDIAFQIIFPEFINSNDPLSFFRKELKNHT
jgi:hypothetical protein